MIIYLAKQKMRVLRKTKTDMGETMSKNKLAAVVKSGILLAVMALVFLFILSVGKEATATTVDFDNLSKGQPLYDQYSAQGIHFRDGLDLSGNHAGVVAATGYASTEQSATPFFIMFDNPANYFSFYKWEPAETTPPFMVPAPYGTVVEQPPQEVVDTPPPQEAPAEDAPQDDYTVYWEFYKLDGTYQLVGSISNSDKDVWVPVSFTSSEQISAVKIYGIIDGGGPFYLDNLQFETTSNAVPEPATMLLLGLGLIGLAGVRRKFTN